MVETIRTDYEIGWSDRCFSRPRRGRDTVVTTRIALITLWLS
jgi:hypothetical protein